LYGWGSNEGLRLGLPSSIETLTKPTPLAFFNNPKRFKLLDISAGDEHSLIHLEETFLVEGESLLRTYQVGLNQKDVNHLYRGVEKDVLIANKGIAPVAMFDNYEVKVMACGHKATIV
jgi:hypothetical protein